MIQTIKYKCCGKTFAACQEPYCYEDEDWLKNLKRYVSRGDTVQMIEDGQGVQLQKCTCHEEKKSPQLSLFD